MGEGQARTEAAEINSRTRRTDGSRMEAYRCPDGNDWHIGRANKSQAQRRRPDRPNRGHGQRRKTPRRRRWEATWWRRTSDGAWYPLHQ